MHIIRVEQRHIDQGNYPFEAAFREVGLPVHQGVMITDWGVTIWNSRTYAWDKRWDYWRSRYEQYGPGGVRPAVMLLEDATMTVWMNEVGVHEPESAQLKLIA